MPKTILGTDRSPSSSGSFPAVAALTLLLTGHTRDCAIPGEAQLVDWVRVVLPVAGFLRVAVCNPAQ